MAMMRRRLRGDAELKDVHVIDFVPSKALHDALAQARCDIEAWEMVRPKQSNRETQRADWAGGQLGAMLSSPDHTLLYLKSNDTKLRLAAVGLMVDYWPPRESFAAPCLELAFGDPEPAIRGGAISGLLALTQYINDHKGWLKDLFKGLYGQLSEQAVASAKRVVDECQASIQQFERETMKKLAGAELDSMLRSRPAAESFLCSPDPKMREAALFALAHNWEFTKEFADQCEAILCNDPDTQVRLGALAQLGTFYFQSDDSRIGQMLGRMVYDAEEAIDLRTHAYRLLFEVRGMPWDVAKRALSPELRFPEEVDWEFVDSFLYED